MAAGKEGMGRENRKHLRDEIQNLLGAIKSDQNDLVVDTDVSNETKGDSPYDFEEMSVQFTKKAREITDSLFKNFVDIGVFDESDYSKHKKELDTINISNLFFQLKTLKITIIKLMEEITAGNTTPRLIEAMGSLQDKMTDLTKMQANYMVFLEETYEKLNAKKSVNPEASQVGSPSNEGQFFITVGTKNMIKSLPTAEKATNKEVGKLVDPRKKSDLMRDREIESDDDDEADDSFIDISEII